ncbi:hypothetical protein Mapa_001938 [Marchantia paleacea]|nr:hypothetical protein Mapa_001938 [Marchantia paleacea]
MSLPARATSMDTQSETVETRAPVTCLIRLSDRLEVARATVAMYGGVVSSPSISWSEWTERSHMTILL